MVTYLNENQYNGQCHWEIETIVNVIFSLLACYIFNNMIWYNICIVGWSEYFYTLEVFEESIPSNMWSFPWYFFFFFFFFLW